MNSINDLLKRIALALIGLSLMAYGLWPRSDESATGTRTRNAASVGSGAKATTPPLVKIPIKDMRVGTRVPAFNPEVSAAERRQFTEPNWYRWMKLKLEMPKPDGTLLEIEMLRSEEWLIQQIAAVVQPESIMLPAYSEPERTAANASVVSDPSSLGSLAIATANNAATMEATVTETTVTESRSSESRSSESRSSEARLSEARSSEVTPPEGFGVPLRPIYFHLAELLGEAAAGGNEVMGLVVQLDLPELGLSGPAWIVDLEPAPITPPGPGQVVTATFKHASANVLDLVLTSTPPTTQTTSHSTQPSSPITDTPSPSALSASSSTLSASPAALSDPPTESIGVTTNHPFWSVDRAEFVQAGDLTIGERLQTLAGDIVWVQQKLPRPGPEPVYNLEVHAEHVYYVGTSGVLAHNVCSKTRTPWQRNVYQRSDIDWDLMRPDGLTNLQAARRGYAPLRRNPKTGKWEDTVLHHLNDDPRGGVVEIWRSTHGRFHKHISRGANPWRKQRADWANAWNNEQSAYWRWRTGAYNPIPTSRLRLPGDL